MRARNCSDWELEQLVRRCSIDFKSYHELQATCTLHRAYCIHCSIPLSILAHVHTHIHTHTYTHTHLTALCPGLPRWAGTREVKPILILLKQETVSGSGISWAICKSAPRSRQITMPAPHHSVFYRPDALPAAQPTVSKHWRHWLHVLSLI